MLINLTQFARSEEKDPKKPILDAIGHAIGDITLMGGDVLVATYVEPEKTKGGVYMPETRLSESRWQGKSGLVLAMGHDAFRWFEEGQPYEGPKPSIHDWVFYRASDSWEICLCPDSESNKGYSVRMIADKDIKGILSRPDLIY